MSFTKTFDELFRSIFGSNRKKPRLRRTRTGWVCYTADGRRGFGATPTRAYEDWQSIGLPRGHVPPRPFDFANDAPPQHKT